MALKRWKTAQIPTITLFLNSYPSL
uniref:Uncharacterized protein n=1 Tax=Rhizophora mucronata TaxID=61149 RepID=A0A2P2PXG9_RHIMU